MSFAASLRRRVILRSTCSPRSMMFRSSCPFKDVAPQNHGFGQTRPKKLSRRRGGRGGWQSRRSRVRKLPLNLWHEWGVNIGSFLFPIINSPTTLCRLRGEKNSMLTRQPKTTNQPTTKTTIQPTPTTTTLRLQPISISREEHTFPDIFLAR